MENQRYDRMIATVLALPQTDSAARNMMWRQLVDLLVQAGDAVDPTLAKQAHHHVAMLQPLVPEAVRRRAAASVADRARDIASVAIFASDIPSVAAPVLARAQLPTSDWLRLIPTLAPPSRTLLRNRRDLSPQISRALASFGHSDHALPPGDAAEIMEAPHVSQISDLVARIEAYRTKAPPHLATHPATAPDSFAFETDSAGQIDWVDGVSRAAIIGLSIAEEAPPRAAGVDGQAAGAFRRRAPMRDARMLIDGHGPASGDWLISAIPVFDPRTGRFTGFHGSARRPLPEERAGADYPPSISGIDPDSLRQIVHELRTPLNAIHGFADMIDQQFLGPAASAYRERARAVVLDARRMLEVVDDLDAAARAQSGRLDIGARSALALQPLVRRVVDDIEPGAMRRDVAMVVSIDPAAYVDAPRDMLGRIVRRLITAMTAAAGVGELLKIDSATSAGGVALRFSRPMSLAGRDERALLDPSFGPEGNWPDAPLLGLGFTLRLIGNLAREFGGRFAIEDDAFMLHLPGAQGVDLASDDQA